jgi:hypothetical protein
MDTMEAKLYELEKKRSSWTDTLKLEEDPIWENVFQQTQVQIQIANKRRTINQQLGMDNASQVPLIKIIFKDFFQPFLIPISDIEPDPAERDIESIMKEK